VAKECQAKLFTEEPVIRLQLISVPGQFQLMKVQFLLPPRRPATNVPGVKCASQSPRPHQKLLAVIKPRLRSYFLPAGRSRRPVPRIATRICKLCAAPAMAKPVWLGVRRLVQRLLPAAHLCDICLAANALTGLGVFNGVDAHLRPLARLPSLYVNARI